MQKSNIEKISITETPVLPADHKRVILDSGKRILIPTTKGVFADIRYDVPFKLAFGEHHAVQRLRDLVNSVLARLNLPVILDPVTQKDRESNGDKLGDKKILLDSHLMDSRGRLFNVEMQKDAAGQHKFIMRRLEMYQGRNKGAQSPYPNAVNKYDVPPVFTIMFTDFILSDKWPMIVQLYDANLEYGYSTLDPINGDQTIIIQLPKFIKQIDELIDDLDVFLYIMNHMGSMLDIPQQFDNEKFKPIFEKLRIKNKNVMQQYELSEKMLLTYEYKVQKAAEAAKLEGKLEGEKRATQIINNLILELIKRADPTLPSVEQALKLSMDEKERLYNSLIN